MVVGESKSCAVRLPGYESWFPSFTHFVPLGKVRSFLGSPLPCQLHEYKKSRYLTESWGFTR
jgi:hypothetical protein